MKVFFLVGLFLPFFIYSQESASGIQWEEKLTWIQLKEKAKKENKYIFLDAYATWCKPCKAMDIDVYSSGKVGEYANRKFISVKVQMDSSKMDNDDIRKWYADALTIQKMFDVSVFPSFLFFSPEGNIVHRGFGYKSMTEFMNLLQQATNPTTQFYTLLDEFKSKKLTPEKMRYLLGIADVLNDKDLVKKLRSEYIEEYMYKLKDEELLSKSNLVFIWPYLKSSSGKIFKLVYQNQNMINQMFNNKRLVQQKIEPIISKEEIYPRLWHDPKNWMKSTPITHSPDWKSIQAIVLKKYDKEYANRTVLDAQIIWYQHYKKDWVNATRYYVKKIETFGLDEAIAGFGYMNVNENIWYIIFEHSNDTVIIKKALQWIDRIFEDLDKRGFGYGYNEASIIDTYANLLYKIGRKQEAITWEQKAIEISRKDNNEERVKSFQEIIKKMEKGIPTWPTESASIKK